MLVFFRRFGTLVLFCTVACLGSGCGDSNLARGPAKEDPISFTSNRKSIVGRWFLSQSVRGVSAPMLLIEILDNGDGRWDAILLTAGQDIQFQPQISLTNVSEESVEFVVTAGQRSLSFEGALQDNGVVLGNVTSNGNVILAARLIATNDRSMKTDQKVQEPFFSELPRASDRRLEQNVDMMREFIEAHPDSPLALESSGLALRLARRQQLSEELVRQIAERYRHIAKHWGERMVHRACTDIAARLAYTRYLPEVVLEHVELADANMPDNMSDVWRERLDTAKGSALLQSDDPQVAERGAAILRAIREQPHALSSITVDLAEYEDKRGEIDAAIDLYAQLEVVPFSMREAARRKAAEGMISPADMRPDPRRELLDLWTQKHGDDEGLSEFLDDVFRKAVADLTTETLEVPPADENRQVLLAELLTGTGCIPCLGPEVSAELVSRILDNTHFILLSYHVNNPTPDPLSTNDTEARSVYYRSKHTPDFYVNGSVAEVGGGFWSGIPTFFKKMHRVIQPELGQATDLKIALDAQVRDDVVEVTADVTGLDPNTEYMRLRLALAEDDLAYAAPNGVRVHKMVVRKMPGGAAGIRPTDGVLRFTGQVPLASLAWKSSMPGDSTAASDRQAKVDNLRLVGFVQNDFSKEVLQAAVVPVTTSSATDEPAAKPEKLPAEAEKLGEDDATPSP